MNIDPSDNNYIDGRNIYPLQEYIDEVLTTDIITNNVYMNDGTRLNEVCYYSNISNLYIKNNKSVGEIRFSTAINYPQNGSDYGTKIDFNGNLQVYHNYNILQPTFSAGWYNVGSEILQLKADGINTDAQLTALEAGAVYIQNEVNDLIILNGTLNQKMDALACAVGDAQRFNILRDVSQDPIYNALGTSFYNDLFTIEQRAGQAYNNSLQTGILYGAAFGIGSAIFGYLTANTERQQTINALSNNTHFTQTQKDAIVNANSNVACNLSNISNLNRSLYNLNINQAFINSNITLQQTISNLNVMDLKFDGVNISNIYLKQNGGSLYNTLTFQKSTSGAPTAGFFGGTAMGDRIIYQPSTTTTDYPCSIGINNTTSNMWYSLSSNYSNSYYFGGDKTLDISSNLINFKGIINASNITSNNFSISNITQNTIINDTPNVQKKFGFAATCSTAILMPDNITYYKCDIDLRNYTKTKTVANPNTPFRIFKIIVYFASVYFEYFTSGTPNVLTYEVFMSNETQGGQGGIGSAGINICAIGYPINYNLNAVLPSQLSLVRSADFNYICILSRVNGTIVNVIIEDLLF